MRDLRMVALNGAGLTEIIRHLRLEREATIAEVVGVSFLSVTYRAPKKTNRFTEFELKFKLSRDHELGKSARDRRPQAPNPKRFVPLLTQLHLRQVRQENALLTTFH